MTHTFVEDVNQTSAACVSRCCMNTYRKQACIISELCPHSFKTVARLSLSRSTIVCLSSVLTCDECVLHFLFRYCVSEPVLSAVLHTSCLSFYIFDMSGCSLRSINKAFLYLLSMYGSILLSNNLTKYLINSISIVATLY